VVYKEFVAGSYTLQSVDADCQRCINLIPQVDESGAGKANVTFINTPGLIAFSNVGADPTRMLYPSTVGRVFAVTGYKLVEVMSDGTFNQLGTLKTHTGVVSVSDNGTQMMLVDGPNGYSLTFADNTYSVILDVNFHGGDTITFQDGRFIFNQPGTQDFWYTDLYATTIQGLSFEAAEGSPDKLIALLSDGTNIWLFGDVSTEVFYDQGDPNTPFTRVQGALIPIGIAATFSAAKLKNTIIWLAKDQDGQGYVVQTQGYAQNRISTHAMEQEIQRYETISDAEAWTYQQDGHAFYVLTFPTAGKTWVFDMITGLWHERAYTGDGVLVQALPRNHCYAFGKHLVGSYLDGNIYEMTPLAFTDAGTVITRLRRAPIISQENKRITFNSIEFDMQTGLGDGTTNPQCMMRFSNDSGNTWSNEKYASLGKIGAVSQRVIFRRLGQARNRVFELKITDPVAIAIQGAYLDLEADAS
jgi:hypothetical protein